MSCLLTALPSSFIYSFLTPIWYLYGYVHIYAFYSSPAFSQARPLFGNDRDAADPSDASQCPPRLALCFFGQVKNVPAHCPSFDGVLPAHIQYRAPLNFLHCIGEHDVTIDVVFSLEHLITMLRQMGPPGRVSLTRV